MKLDALNFPSKGRHLTWLLTLAACLTLGAREGYSADEASTFDVDRLEHRLETIKRKEHSLRRAFEQAKSEAEKLHARILVRGRAYYRATRGLPGDSFMEHAVRVERLRQGLLKDVRRLNQLQDENRGRDHKLALLEERRAPLELEQHAAGRARDALLSRQERERAFEMAFSNSVGSRSDHTAVYSAGIEGTLLESSFGRMRGRLPFPVPGRAEIERVEFKFARGPGLVLRSALGTPARAVFQGRVAFADEYPEYGKTVILDHGDGYFTVSSRLDSIEVAVGDDVPATARLGLCGTAGGMSQLYFEVRSQNETLPPGDWLGI